MKLLGRPSHGIRRFWVYLILIGISGLFVTPLVWMGGVSLKPIEELARFPPTFFPSKPTSAAYRNVMRSESFDFLLYARNTLVIAGLSMVGMVASSAIAAYGFARMRFKGNRLLFGICLATMMIPFPVTMVPTYVLFKWVGWTGSIKPLWVPAWFGAAFNVFLLRQFFLGIPRELEEAALLDGCSRWGCFCRIVLPLSKPALAVVALFHFIAVWNDLLGPMIYLSHQEQFTLALGLQFMQAKAGDTPWNELFAATTLIVAPIVVLFLFTQRTFVRGLAATGIKG